MEYEHLNGTAMLLVALLIWAVYKARTSAEANKKMTKNDDCLNNTVICGDCLRPSCKGCEQ